jgi:hypothetical protein
MIVRGKTVSRATQWVVIQTTDSSDDGGDAE